MPFLQRPYRIYRIVGDERQKDGWYFILFWRPYRVRNGRISRWDR